MTSRRAVIASAFATPLGRHEGRSAYDLQAEAAAGCLAQAGMGWCDVDGFLTTPVGSQTATWFMPCSVVGSYLNLQPAYVATVDLSGASGTEMAWQAAQAVMRGECEVALCTSGANLLSERSAAGSIAHMAQTGVAHPEFEAPYGPTVASLYALWATAYLHRHKAPRAGLAAAAVSAREYAFSNPKAFKREKITIDDVLASRPVADPLQLLDTSVTCDGAGAILVTTEDRARELGMPYVHLTGHGAHLHHGYVGELRDWTTTGAGASAHRALEAAGLTLGDIDAAYLYDCFTITVLLELEEIGFCKPGTAGHRFIDQEFGASGSLPVNPHGGLLSAGHPGLAGGFLHVVEAVRQLQGIAGGARIAKAENLLVHGTGGIAGIHSTLTLRRGPM